MHIDDDGNIFDEEIYTYDRVIEPVEKRNKKEVWISPSHEKDVNDELKRQGKTYRVERIEQNRMATDEDEKYSVVPI